ncbi:MAG: hypothetical protein RDV48_21190 [Candidatus Eremiobacteraeota bacterium]|nr:hypothetical protein [Candidatus Eremiobacteraeota bacterium]
MRRRKNSTKPGTVTRLLRNLAAIPIFLAFCAVLLASPSFAGKKTFSIRLEQRGAPVPIVSHEALLEREPFTIVMIFQRPMVPEVLVNASYTGESFEIAKTGYPLDKIPGFQETGMADYWLNPLEELMVSKTAPNVWYYESPCEHRYNLIKEQDGKWECTRNIAALMDRDGTRLYEKIEKSDIKELYIVFVSAEWTKDFSAQRENHREWVKITF